MHVLVHSSPSLKQKLMLMLFVQTRIPSARIRFSKIPLPPRNLSLYYTWPIFYSFQPAWDIPNTHLCSGCSSKMVQQPAEESVLCLQPTPGPNRRNNHDFPFYAKHPRSLSHVFGNNCDCLCADVGFTIRLTETHRLRKL